MVGYRIYRVSDGRFVGVHEILAASDSEAMLEAHKLLDGLDLEVWRGNEKIGYLQADQAKSERGDGVPRKGSSDGPHPDPADRMRAPYSDPPL